jgi:HPt (histidine-containing phosphotransfer) domain-containing protein
MDESFEVDAVEKRRDKYVSSIPERLNSVKASIDAVRHSPTKENVEALSFLLHTLAGNSAIYGYDKVTDLCKDWDKRLLKLSHQLPSCEIQLEFFSEIEEMFKKLQEGFDSK